MLSLFGTYVQYVYVSRTGFGAAIRKKRGAGADDIQTKFSYASRSFVFESVQYLHPIVKRK